MTLRRSFAVVLAVLGLAAALVAAGPASAARRAVAYAPAATATIKPGVQTVTAGAQCTANFVYSDGTTVYLGQAAHCSSTGGNTATDGCTTRSLPLGTKVSIQGARYPGVMVYNSWVTMQQKRVRDANTCAYNDLALIKIDPRDAGRVNPSMPFWGGPTGLATGGTQVGDTVLSYGNSSLRLGISALSPKQGVSVGDTGGGWSTTVYTLTPGIPGDSGSGFLTADGKALGVLSTLAIAPLAGSNGVGNLAKELAYLKANTAFTNVNLVKGTVPFTGPLL